MTQHRIYTMSFAKVYPLLVAKAERKGRTKAEVDQIIHWLTGYGQEALACQLAKDTDYETFFAQAKNSGSFVMFDDGPPGKITMSGFGALAIE